VIKAIKEGFYHSFFIMSAKMIFFAASLETVLNLVLFDLRAIFEDYLSVLGGR
jgi:hypothetical protein